MWRPTPTPSLTSTAGWYNHQGASHLTCTAPMVPTGMVYTLAEVNAFWMMLLTAACQGCRPSLYRQLRSWVAKSSTMVPQLLHSCERQRGVPSLRYTATWGVSSSIRSPRDNTRRAFNQVPDFFLLVTRRQARDLASGASSSSA